MTDTKLDPRSLTPEEQRIVDDTVTGWVHSVGTGVCYYDGWIETYGNAIARILARRALFAEPAQEEDPGDACLCPACSPSRFGGEPAEWEPDLSKLAERIFREQPAQAAQPQGVRLAYVREALREFCTLIEIGVIDYADYRSRLVSAALAELDAVEGVTK